MGSGNSRLNLPESESILIKTHSTIMGRFEEFRKRRNAESTLSKKQLLKDAVEEDYCSSISQPSSHETSCEVEDHKVKGETFAEKVSSVAPMANSECEIKEDNDNVEKVNKEIDLSHNKVVDENEKVEAENKTEEGNIEWLVEEVKEENDYVSAKRGEKDDNDGDDDEEIGRFLCPGSPSFRIYCIEEHKKEDQQQEEESKNVAIVLHHKSPSADCVSSIVSRSPRISNEVPQIVGIEPTYSKRKGNMMRKFRAVRTLLKVKSCYHPICTCISDDRSHFIAAKAVN